MGDAVATRAQGLSIRIAGAIVPALCLVGALLVWEVWRIADAITESTLPVGLYRVGLHVILVLAPLTALVFVAVAPPRQLSVRGYIALAVVLAGGAAVWTPTALFLTYLLGA